MLDIAMEIRSFFGRVLDACTAEKAGALPVVVGSRLADVNPFVARLPFRGWVLRALQPTKPPGG
jgi:hypothetical protein